MQINFNSRPSARGDWLDVGFNVTRPNISIHAPPRGATQRPPRPALAIPFQFTPLREGRLEEPMNYKKQDIISIHAPPRGAT